ncbi:EpsG family protein [Pseudoalteromonas rubra]|uniref:EpsG family protein n=1 Tax=Pseudoalteromonas rubra TaxID=43658 RepID=UPI000F78DF11|nr:EpsG family protein [Pseudoalteromonas rubra]
MNHFLTDSISLGSKGNSYQSLNRAYLFSVGVIAIGFMLLPFFPAMSNLIAVACLILSLHGRAAVSFMLLAVVLFILSLGINAGSYFQFVYHESDFTSYYNNFLTFDGGLNGDWFVYSGGIEVGLPFVNFILSFFIGNKPYLFLTAHLTIQVVLLIYLARIIKDRFELSVFEFGVLLGFFFTFYKYLGMLNHMRQAYSSIFVLIAVFSRGKSQNYFLLVAFLFHLSTVVVYPLAKLVYFYRGYKYKRYLIYLSIPTAFFVFFSFDFFSRLSLIDNFLMEKLLFTFREREDDSAYISSVLYSIIKIIYLLPLLLLNELYCQSSEKRNLRLSILAVIIPVLALSFLPSFVSRIYEVILVTSVGLLYFYLYINCHSRGRVVVRCIVMAFLFILNFRWFFLDESFYARYPLISSEPFYYFDAMVEESTSISRFDLPALEDINKN